MGAQKSDSESALPILCRNMEGIGVGFDSDYGAVSLLYRVLFAFYIWKNDSKGRTSHRGNLRD